MTTQATLFDLGIDARPKPQREVHYADWDALEDWAFCYTATAMGNNSGIRFLCSTTDAQKWCANSASQGVLHGTAWAYFWTTVGRFLRHYCDFTGAQGLEVEAVLDVSGLVDNGEWDARLEAAGVTTKHGPRDFGKVLEPLGVQVVGVPA